MVSDSVKSAVYVFLVCIVGVIGCEKTVTPKGNNQTTKTNKTNKTVPSKTTDALKPPADDRPQLQEGQLPFKWATGPAPKYTSAQMVLFVPFSSYAGPKKRDHIHLNYRPGRVVESKGEHVMVRPLSAKSDAPPVRVPHVLVIALPPKQEVQPGDVVLTWSRTKYPYLQRAHVLTAGDAPAVHMLDLADSDAPTAKQTLKPGTFVKIQTDQPAKPGAAVTWKDGAHDRHGVILASNATQRLVLGFGGEAFVLKAEQTQPLPAPNELTTGQSVRVPWFNRYISGKVIKQDQMMVTVQTPEATLRLPRVDVWP